MNAALGLRLAAGFFAAAFLTVAMGLLPVVWCERTMPIGLKLTLLSRAPELHRGRLYRIFPRKKHDLRGRLPLRRTTVARRVRSVAPMPQRSSGGIGRRGS